MNVSSKKILEFICAELGIDAEDVNKNVLLESLITDDYEMQELLESVANEFEIEIEIEPQFDWSLVYLAEAIADSV